MPHEVFCDALLHYGLWIDLMMSHFIWTAIMANDAKLVVMGFYSLSLHALGHLQSSTQGLMRIAFAVCPQVSSMKHVEANISLKGCTIQVHCCATSLGA